MSENVEVINTSSNPIPVTGLAHNLLDNSVDKDTTASSVVRGDTIIGNSTPLWTRLPIGANATVLTSNGTDPSWQAPAGGSPHNLLDGVIDQDTKANAVVEGDLIIGNATPLWDVLTIGTSAYYLRSNGTLPSWSSLNASDLSGRIATGNDYQHALLDGATDNDTVAHAPVEGDLIIGNSTPAWTRLAIGTTGKYLRTNGTDPSWSALNASDLSGRVAQANSLSGTMVLINANETPASHTVTAAVTNLITYSLAVNTYTKIIVESEGYIGQAVGGTKQLISISTGVSGGTTQDVAIETSGANLPQYYAWAVKCSFALMGGGTLIVAETSAANDANSTVYANSLRVYGVI